MLIPKKVSAKVKAPKTIMRGEQKKRGVKLGDRRTPDEFRAKVIRYSISGELWLWLVENNIKNKSGFLNLAMRTMVNFKTYRSLPYDRCDDCGCDMTAPIDPSGTDKAYTDEFSGRIIDVFVQCEGCGSRSGWRQYEAERHISPFVQHGMRIPPFTKKIQVIKEEIVKTVPIRRRPRMR